MYIYSETSATRRSLLSTLAYCSEKELPSEWDGKHVWISAIALIHKKDGCSYYGLVKRGDYGKPILVKDFGGLSSVMEIAKIYPYEYLDEEYEEKYKCNTKNRKTTFISSNNRELLGEDLSGKTQEEIDELFTQTLIKLKIENETRNWKGSEAAFGYDSCTEQGQQVGGENGKGTACEPQENAQ